MESECVGMLYQLSYGDILVFWDGKDNFFYVLPIPPLKGIFSIPIFMQLVQNQGFQQEDSNSGFLFRIPLGIQSE